jgi:hypothetical protein
MVGRAGAYDWQIDNSRDDCLFFVRLDGANSISEQK